jgi:hypothetical protein
LAGAAALGVFVFGACSQTRGGTPDLAVGEPLDAAMADDLWNPPDVASGDLASNDDAGTLSQTIYAHTNTTLFQLNSPTSAPVMVGVFDCIGGGVGMDTSMTDLAVDASQTLWGVSQHNVYKLAIQGGTVHCATTIPLPGGASTFYGLSFAPAGVLDATKEVLVAVDTSGALWSVDALGTLVQHGTLGTVPANDGHGHTYANAGTAWELSGDIAMFANNGSPVGYVTVRDCPSPPSPTGCNTVDTLVALDMTKIAQAGTQSVIASVRGQIVKAASCSDSATGYGSFYGIAASGGSVIGFSHAGSIVRISEVDGTGCLVLSTPADIWSGAGISTLAAP